MTTAAFATFRPPLKAVVLGVPATGILLACVAATTGGFVAPDAWRWAVVPLTFAGVLLAERYPVKIGAEQKVTLSALPCMIAMLLLPPGVGPLTAAASVFVAGRLGHASWTEGAVNAGNTLAAASLGAIIGAVRGDAGILGDAGAVLGALVYVTVNLAVAVLPAAIHTGRPYLSLLLRTADATWPASLTLAACAVSMAVLAVEAPVAAPMPLVVLPLIYRMNRAIEAQASANEQITAVLAAQRRFLTDVSHQVATPLATIMTNLSILRRVERGRPASGAIDDSVAEAERMKRMLSRLRALAHADEDVPLRRELVDLAELTSDVVHAYAAQAGQSGVGLVAEVGAGARVSADKDLLREAVANLVDNAVRVSPRGAEVRLRVDRATGGPVIAVIDHGPGIEKTRLPGLFERFQRSDSGSGLGLAIARRVVERHGGTLRVDTEPGAGSTFTIQLPA